MAEQRKEETRPRAAAQQEAGGPETSGLAKKGEKLKEEIDQLLEELDGLLEENAEEFVASYVQRGGQ